MLGNIYGEEKTSSNFVSACFNPATNKVDVFYNSYIKTINAKVYDIDSDYDFGAIDPADVIVDMYSKGLTETPGIKVRA